MTKVVALAFKTVLVGLVTIGLVSNCTSSKSGGPSGTGGAGSTGGQPATGGLIYTGGSTARGGNAASGGSSATGGVNPTGGATVTGGSSSSGGSSATGGMTSTGGTTVSGGSTASGGSSATGGVTSSGGVTAAGGTASTGGSAGGNADAGLIDASGDRRDAVAGDTRSGAVEVARDTSAGKSDAAGAVSFKTEILPMLKTNCVSCHGPTQQSMGVRVDTYANVSANLQAVTDVLVNGGMPPSGPLSDANRQLFQTWVDQGALNN